MFMKDLPSIGTLLYGVKLMQGALAQVNSLSITGSADTAQSMVDFWTYQKTAPAADSGHPSDGPFVGAGYADLRISAYKVVSYLRLYGGSAELALWEDFCDFLIAYYTTYTL